MERVVSGTSTSYGHLALPCHQFVAGGAKRWTLSNTHLRSCSRAESHIAGRRWICSASIPRSLQTTVSLGWDSRVMRDCAGRRKSLRIVHSQAARREAEAEYIPPFKEDSKLEVSRIDGKLREKVESAIDRLGSSVTVGDVAATAGVTISDAEAALNALAADCQGTLQVSSSGDVVYSLPSNFRNILRAKSWLIRTAPALKKAESTLNYIVRVSFGSALVVSVAVVWAAIFAILSSSQNDRDDRRRDVYYRSPMSTIINIGDLFWYWDPYYYQRQRMRLARGEQMNFFESIFSFVFGDGDPNLDYDEKRWKLVGQYIQHRGGVVTAEELAPFLDVPSGDLRQDGTTVDEGYVVPALVRFNGSPEVDASGNLLYRFPTLQRTRQSKVSPSPPAEAAALERSWDFTKASTGQKVGAVALGVVNLVGVAFLASLLANPVYQYRLAATSLAFIPGIFPWLQAYAGAFFAIPAIRWFLNLRRNEGVERRNASRLAALAALRQPPTNLRAKLLSAAREAQRVVIEDKDIIYRSDREATPVNELDDFDRRLGATNSRSAPLRGQPAPQKVEDWLS